MQVRTVRCNTVQCSAPNDSTVQCNDSVCATSAANTNTGKWSDSYAFDTVLHTKLCTILHSTPCPL